MRKVMLRYILMLLCWNLQPHYKSPMISLLLQKRKNKQQGGDLGVVICGRIGSNRELGTSFKNYQMSISTSVTQSLSMYYVYLSNEYEPNMQSALYSSVQTTNGLTTSVTQLLSCLPIGVSTVEVTPLDCKR